MFSRLKALVSRFFHKEQFFASIGDVCTEHLFEERIYPKIVVYDNRTCRVPIGKKLSIPRTYRQLGLEFRGTYSKGILDFLKSCCEGKGKTAICVDGEDDNLIWGIIFYSPLGVRIRAGVEEMVVDKSLKKVASSKLKKRGCLYVG